jgi:molybdopterin converting factor small subunit
LITVRFFAAAREAVGSSEIQLDAGNLEELIDICTRDDVRLRKVLDQCSFLINGLIAHNRHVPLAKGSTVDVLPPFAGG